MNMFTATARRQRNNYIFEPAANQPKLVFDAGVKPAIKQGIDLDSFVAGACDYLNANTKQTTTAGTPYIAHGDVTLREFTAAIRITGGHSGTIYFTASRAILTVMLMYMGESGVTNYDLNRLLRKISSSMAATARRSTGSDCLVWEPSISVDHALKLDSRHVRSLIVPIQWRKFIAQIVLCLE
jgi:hypothetical protein